MDDIESDIPPLPAIVGEVERTLGRMVMSFSSMESATRDANGALLYGINEQDVQILTSELSFRKARGVLVALSRERLSGTELLGRIEALMKQARSLEQRRNQLTHSVWLWLDAIDVRPRMAREKLRVSDSGRHRRAFEEFHDVGDLDRFVDEMGQVSDALFEIALALRRRGISRSEGSPT